MIAASNANGSLTFHIANYFLIKFEHVCYSYDIYYFSNSLRLHINHAASGTSKEPK